jgi:hypothetical protein
MTNIGNPWAAVDARTSAVGRKPLEILEAEEQSRDISSSCSFTRINLMWPVEQSVGKPEKQRSTDLDSRTPRLSKGTNSWIDDVILPILLQELLK